MKTALTKEAWEQSFERIGDITVTNLFWDCDCTDHFIHPKSDTVECPNCGMAEFESPDSRANEVLAAGLVFISDL